MNIGFGARQPLFESWCWHLPDVWPLASHLTTLWLNFLNYKIARVMTVPTS